MNFEKLKNFMDHLTDWIIPGNSIVVYHKDKEVFRYSSGYSDVENKIPMKGNELFNIYSCSKVATVVAALQLYERGMFLLDDPVSDYIEEFKEMYVKQPDGSLKKAEKPITFRHLFTHTAGLSYNLRRDLLCENLKKYIIESNGKAPTVEAVRAMAKEPLLFEPGERWSYSLGHDALAAIVEIISEKRFSEYVVENIFKPIGVEDVYYHRNDEIYSKMAQQYQYVTDAGENIDIVKMQVSSDRNGVLVNAGKEVSHVLGSEYDSGGAGITTSVESYAKFANTLAMGGKSTNGERILTKGTIDLMRTNQLNSEQIKSLTWSQLTGYGYGLGVRTVVDKAVAGFNGIHGEFGWGGAAGADILVDPENEFSFFYTHHMLNPQEDYYQPRLRNVAYSCLFD